MTNPAALLANLTHSRRRWVLLGLLGLLHLIHLQGVESAIGRTLLAVHIGLFLLWQPFVRAEMRLSGLQLVAIAVAILLTLFLINSWLLILWVMALAGIVGGKVFFFAGRWAKLFYLFVLAYLISLLLMALVPDVLPGPFGLPDVIERLARASLPLLFPVMAILPIEQEVEGEAEVVDFVYSAFVFLMLAVLVLGSISAMLLLKQSYIEALIYTLVTLSATLLLMAWAWNPRIGFSGMNVFFSRYLLSVGLPFERWLRGLADHMQREEQPEKFLDEALAGMARLPWVIGSEWRAGGNEGCSGRREGKRTEFRHGSLTIAVYTYQPLSPTLTWHFDLLAQLLGEFYLAKQRAMELQQLSYVKAIHQTGARLTHDVKNLLQSLNALCLAAAKEGETPSLAYLALLRRQLPVIAQRLQQTLDKLRRPEMEGIRYVSADRWWQGLRTRYAQAGICFSPEKLACEEAIPTTLFNSVAENLLENALHKKHAAPALRIEARFSDGNCLSLTVCDDGPAIPAEIAEGLFHSPVASSTGLGIGLYQAARHAEHYGYDLRICSNETGRVCFELRQDPEGGSPATPA